MKVIKYGKKLLAAGALFLSIIQKIHIWYKVHEINKRIKTVYMTFFGYTPTTIVCFGNI